MVPLWFFWRAGSVALCFFGGCRVVANLLLAARTQLTALWCSQFQTAVSASKRRHFETPSPPNAAGTQPTAARS
jgi:hypothetical protein